jgi:hypothetical protein
MTTLTNALTILLLTPSNIEIPLALCFWNHFLVISEVGLVKDDASYLRCGRMNNAREGSSLYHGREA